VSGILSRRPARRLLFAVAILAVIDPFIPGLVDRLEAARYESTRPFRFENSDLFSLGPLVRYLRAHPRGDRPRVVFFGNSLVWGYFLRPGDSLPAQFQRLTPDARVFNLGINGFESGSAYLVTRNIVDAVDTIYLFHIGARAHPSLPALVAVEPADVARFELTPPDHVETWLAARLGFWRLYRDGYRLQAALFGTSTRQYLYRHKAELPRALWREVRGHATDAAGAPAAEPAMAAGADVVAVRAELASAPVGDVRRRDLAAAYPLLWDYSELVRAHGKHAVVVEIDRPPFPETDRVLPMPPLDRADLNRIFQPHVSFVVLSIPPALRFDEHHLSAEGTRAVAQALRHHAAAVRRGS
jgi:hypothetical protein